MGPLAQNPSQSAAWPKPACDWATFGKFGGSGRPSVEIALRWPATPSASSSYCRFVLD
eukprot:COSAG01_NODE_30304_length_618_cov_2.491329_1_plen_57_part_10